MERLLNPKRLNIELETLPIKIIDGVSYRTFTKQYTTYDGGGCQCYKDCDCSSRSGVFVLVITWYRNTKFDNTDKCFYSEPYTQKEYDINKHIKLWNSIYTQKCHMIMTGNQQSHVRIVGGSCYS